MTSKPRFGFKGLTAVTNRTTQKVKEKVGKAEETVDVGFNQEKDRFENHYKHLKKLSKDLSDFTKSLRCTCSSKFYYYYFIIFPMSSPLVASFEYTIQ